ncbi:MAG: (deoxy)nucleoside triphosphate pyrophosphohydrolase [Tannerellaceae bacterium]
MNPISVVAAVIEVDGKILCVQRDKSKYDYISYKYEFPGGKVEPGELMQDALKREIQEELDYAITVEAPISSFIYDYPDFSVHMHFYYCTASTTVFTLNEHIQAQWLERANLLNLDWAAADLPIVEKLMQLK